MSIVQALADAATTEVEVGDLIWRVRRVNPRDMMRHGVPGVMILREVLTPSGKDSPAPRDASAMSTGQREKVLKAQHEFQAIVCAGVLGVREKGGPFEAISVTMDGPSTDGRLWIEDMPPGTVNALYPAIFTLSAPAEVQARLRTFLDGSPETSDDPEDVQALREVAP